ncbi:MAG TPA: DUF748 domain-containing protein [Thermoanaerobaculia bacterium]|nr:DUF748 domain-containing protein [Thermoanaerobaculia bacterium]
MLDRLSAKDRGDEPEPPRRRPQPVPPRRAGRAWRPRNGLLWAAGIVGAILLVLFVVSSQFDGYLRRTLEARMNQRLKGYSVSLGHAHLGLPNLALTLKDLVVRQQANPEPPVVDIPRLKESIEWRELLTLHLVSDARLDRPRIHLDLPQLQSEANDPVSVKDRGWQQALESMYPLKLNHFQIDEGDIVYVDADGERPLHVSHWNLRAENIRNIHSRDRVYPSPVHTDGVIFDTGRGVADGNADFLAEPFLGLHVLYELEKVPLDLLRPLSARANLELHGGILASKGELEYGPRHREARIADVTVRGLRLDYLHSPATTAAEKRRGAAVAKAAKNPQPPVPYRIARLRVLGSEIGIVNRAPDHPYRLFLTDTDLEVTNVSTGFGEPAHAKLTARFMGSGTAHGEARYREAGGNPDLDLSVAVEGANLPALNDLFRSYGNFDVAAGSFSLYTQMRVKDRKISGYVKPLFHDVKVYDPQQDKDKPPLHKLYEKIVGGVSHVLENHQREEVATQADLSGSVDSPKTSTWQIVGRLLENAFVKSILPGFQQTFKKAQKGK